MQRRLIVYLAIILVMTLLLTAGCRTIQNREDSVSDIPFEEEQKVSEKQILTVAVCMDYYKMDLIIERFTALHPDVIVEVDNYKGDEEKYRLQVKTQLLSGTAADIMDAMIFEEEKLSDNGLLADIYPLMKNDPDFKEKDYFMNVIDAMAYKGKLIIFPACWSYNTIGVNNLFSAELIKRFAAYETISYGQLYDLYNSSEETGGRSLCENIDLISAVIENANSFIDLESKQCYFNTPEFIDFICNAKNCTSPRKAADGELGLRFGPKLYRADQEYYAKQYLFADAASTIPFFFFPYLEEEVFTHYIPITNKQGKILQYCTKRLCINEASKNKGLAWEFIKFLTTPQANENIYQPSFSVNRELYKTSISSNIAEFVDDWRKMGLEIAGETAGVVEEVMVKLAVYNDMPMENTRIVQYDIIVDLLTSFYNDVLTAEQAASELQNRFSLILME
ncbi:MAG: extracellular solute-binding protein [Firmicutes bacterium]|nr:extracellular solute-binding protein [Bacillota bacterium]